MLTYKPLTTVKIPPSITVWLKPPLAASDIIYPNE